MTREVVARMPCPTCTAAKAAGLATEINTATIHVANNRRGSLYFRCYDAHGIEVCGTGQLHGPTAQALMRRHLADDADAADPDPAAPEAPPPDPDPEPAPEKPRRSVFGALLMD